MDEEVLQDLFNRAVSQGYGKSIEEFQALLSTDEEVLTDNFNYIKSQGYPAERTIEDFSILVGVKKPDEVVADVTESVGEDGSSVSPQIEEETTVAVEETTC